MHTSKSKPLLLIGSIGEKGSIAKWESIRKVTFITQEHALLYESLISASVVTPIPTSHGRNAVWEI